MMQAGKDRFGFIDSRSTPWQDDQDQPPGQKGSWRLPTSDVARDSVNPPRTTSHRSIQRSSHTAVRSLNADTAADRADRGYHTIPMPYREGGIWKGEEQICV